MATETTLIWTGISIRFYLFFPLESSSSTAQTADPLPPFSPLFSLEPPPTPARPLSSPKSSSAPTPPTPLANRKATITSDLAVQEEIASAYRSLFPSSPCEVLVLGSIEEAVDVVKQASEKERGRKAEVDVLVAGSLHLVGGVMEVAGLGREEVGGLSLE
jgi:hypothetical protein